MLTEKQLKEISEISHVNSYTESKLRAEKTAQFERENNEVKPEIVEAKTETTKEVKPEIVKEKKPKQSKKK